MPAIYLAFGFGQTAGLHRVWFLNWCAGRARPDCQRAGGAALRADCFNRRACIRRPLSSHLAFVRSVLFATLRPSHRCSVGGLKKSWSGALTPAVGNRPDPALKPASNRSLLPELGCYSPISNFLSTLAIERLRSKACAFYRLFNHGVVAD